MSAHRAPRTSHHAVRRVVIAGALAITTGIGALVAAGPAVAAGPWFVAPTGNNGANCLSAATPCATVTGVLAKGGFVTGDTINVAPGTYTDRPLFQAKTANVVGSGPNVVFSGSNAGFAIGVNIGNANTLNLSNVTLTLGRNLSNNLGGGLVVATGRVVGNNVAINGNGGGTITTGGGVYLAAGTQLTMQGGSISNNAASATAGAVHNLGTLTLNGTTVNSNTAANGGAIFNLNGATAVLDAVTVNNNTAAGGAAVNAGNAGAIYTAGTLTVRNGSTFSGNRAVASTNANPGITGYGGTIGGFNLAATAPVITLTDTTINGGGVAGGNAVAGGAVSAYPTTVGGTTTRIDALRLTLAGNVAAAGGGIFTSGTATLKDSTVTQNQATHASAGFGGGVYAGFGANQALTVENTDLTGNAAGTAGGAIATLATVTAEVRAGSTLNGNTAPLGAGAYTAGPVTVRDSEVKRNDASNSGAGLYAAGAATLNNAAVDSNDAAFLGGGIVAASTLNVVNGTFVGNSAFAGGAVVIGANQVASMTGTDLVGNTGQAGGGAIANVGQLTLKEVSAYGNEAPNGPGGAILSGSTDQNISNVTTSLRIDASTFSENEAAGGSVVYAASTSPGTTTNKTSIVNSTLHANVSTNHVGALQLFHGASLTNSTITDNTAVPANGAAYGGIVAFAGQVALSGSVLSGNSGQACFAAVNDGGHNLVNPNEPACGLSAAKQNLVGDPKLGPLGSNGWVTETQVPQPDSPLLDRVPAGTAAGVSDAITGAPITLCAANTTDQRLIARPQGAKCDIGSVEVVQVAPTVDGPAAATGSVGNALAPLTYTTTGSPQPSLSASGLPAGVTFTDNGDGTGTVAGTPGANTGGVHQVTVTATNEAGSADTVLELTINQAPVLSGPAAATYEVGTPGGPTTFTQTSGHPTAVLASLGALPGGVSFSDNGDGSGAYSGTPADGSGGVYPLTVTGSNGTGPDASVPFTLTVNEATELDGPASATFQVGANGQSALFEATGFPVPTLSVDNPGLPGGLGLTGAGAGSARITGLPANGSGGQYTATVRAGNGVGADQTVDVAITINEAPELTGPSSVRFVTGTAATVGFSSDGFPEADLTYTGTLPDGITFTDNGDGSASIGGTAVATAVGDYAITVRAANGVDPAATKQVAIEVVPPLEITTTSLPDAAYKSAYSAFVVASGGQPAYTFEVVGGALPAGLTLGANGMIVGSPTANPGTYSFTVKATDSLDPAQTDTQQLSITVVKGATALDVEPIVLTVTSNLGIKVNLAVLEATLTGGFPQLPLAGQTITLKAGASTVCTATTDSNGHVKCQPSVLNSLAVILAGSVTATYAGNSTWNPSSGSAGLIGS